MYPSVLSSQVQRGLRDFLATSFPVTTPHFAGVVGDFLARDEALFRGPFLSLRLPFRKSGAVREHFPDVPMGFAPFRHQERAFSRLDGFHPRSTLVATGTGSGKTEAFLFPVLNYCLQMRKQGVSGVKAVLIYPMNALATDQARRIARIVDANPLLKQFVSAGLYVGQQDEQTVPIMSATSIITDRDVLRQDPPDILLTNYKMLDYLLIRPADAELWRENGPDTLRFVVVDELHTFDGAQGTDLACLLRRLKARLGTPEGHLCCVGTSATLGAAQDTSALRGYAGRVFGEEFDEDSVVGEESVGVDEFLGKAEGSRPLGAARTSAPWSGTEGVVSKAEGSLPRRSPPEADEDGKAEAGAVDFGGEEVLLPDWNALGQREGESVAEYVRRQGLLWAATAGDEALAELEGVEDSEFYVRLSDVLKRVPLFRALLRGMGGGAKGIEELYEAVIGEDAARAGARGSLARAGARGSLARAGARGSLARAGARGSLERGSLEHFGMAVESLVACVCAARVREPGGERPFLHVRWQMWMRELRRMVCSVGAQPRLEFSDELTHEELKRALPLLHCRECGAMAWGGVLPAAESRVRAGLQQFYTRYFSFATDVIFLFPDDNTRAVDEPQLHLCPACLTLHANRQEHACSFCGAEEATIPVLAWRKTTTGTEKAKSRHDCPYCEGRDSLTILGSRAASLIAVANAQLFASPFNDDRKLLAFSDSVQDASHRAGFFTARTYRFNFRTALLQFLRAEEEERSLEELPARFIDFYREKWKEEEDRFIGTFLPPDMDWLEDYELYQRTGRLPADSDLPAMLERRISWEICSEFGFNARIGRTLEKSGTATAAPRAALVEAVTVRLLPLLREEFGPLRDLTESALGRYLVGLLTQLKTRGGVTHTELHSYIESFGSTYLLNRAPHMPGFGPHARTPGFLTDGRSDRFDRLHTTAGRRGWYEEWAVKCLSPGNEMVAPYLEDVAFRALAALEEGGLLRRTETAKGNVWGIPPAALDVTREVLLLRCARCGHAASGHTKQRTDWSGMPCQRFGCGGAYAVESRDGDYYASLYGEGEIVRLVAREHTGLLPSGVRKDVEERFMHGTKPWDPNLLSCTPTLEMGVDIGDLSTVILCSVPPSQASYVQRVGRAGRRDGNALNLTMAEMSPHDQYFFAEPLSMIGGGVTPPGCFLNAPAVLERQFVAFCFDRWVRAGAAESDIPTKLGAVLNGLRSMPAAAESLEESAVSVFPVNLFSFMRKQRDGLYSDFVALFADELDEHTREYLHEVVYGTPVRPDIEYRILDRLHAQQRELADFEARVRNLSKQIKELQTDPSAGESREERLRELEGERDGLSAIQREIRAKHVLQFLTDEGFLPNYAFPESGIQLRSIIYRHVRKLQGDGQSVKSWYYEYERPAAQALRELAPSSSFYAGGRRVTVDQVNMRLSEPEDWRFCPVCAHAAPDSDELRAAACPHCGEPGWKDASQRRRLLRLRQVLATTSDRESRSRDDHDDRAPSFFVRDLLVHPDPSSITDAWALTDEQVPFGFEFVGRASFVDVNFGAESGEGEAVTIAGRELRRPGFTVCRECGRVQDERNRRKHTSTCKHRGKEDPKLFSETLYLYREFSTEAIRMLLPATTALPSGATRHSFVAALLLGLREKFAGNIDHLQTTVMQEPVPGSGISKHYLVLYDTVPGGTGYLKELMQSTAVLRQVFALALARLESCACNTEARPDGTPRDGCYRCLYAYRLSSAMADISRERATEILQAILADWENLYSVKSIDEITIDPLIESELEKLFLATLREARHGELPVLLKKEFFGHDSGYRVSVGGREYALRLQRSLGKADGVEVSSRADFLFTPLDPEFNMRPVAVYTDGFEYHAAPGRGRIGTDLAQRMSLLRSGRFRVWSITWEDLLAYEKKKAPEENGFLATPPTMLSKLLGHSTVSPAVRGLRSMTDANPMAQLLAYLGDGDDADWERYAVLQTLAGLENTKTVSEIQSAARFDLLRAPGDGGDIPAFSPTAGGTVLHGEREIPVADGGPAGAHGPRCGIVARAIPLASAADPSRYADLALLLRFHDGAGGIAMLADYRKRWNQLLSAVNLWQFVPGFEAVGNDK